jgi:hypothetical protein
MIRGGVERVSIHVAIFGRRGVIVRLATRALKALRTTTVLLRPRCARLAALTARIAIRLWQLSTAATKDVLDDVERRSYCLINFAGCHSQPLHIARCGARSNRRSQATVRSPILNSLPGRLFVRRHVREADDRTGLHFGLRPGADPAVHPIVGIITLPRRYACQRSMRREMRSARPFTVNNSRIDARNGQAYHGRKTTTTNETRPRTVGSRAGEEYRTRRQRRRRFTPCVRPRAGAASRPRVLRARTEAAIARSSMR